MFADFKVYFLAHRVEFPVHGDQQNNFPSALGLVFCLFAVTVINEAYTKQKEQDGQRGLETSLKNNKDGGRSREKKFFLAFQDVFWKFSSRCLPITRSGQIQRKTNRILIVFHDLKDFGGFKGRQEMSRFQVVPFAIVLLTLVLIFP